MPTLNHFTVIIMKKIKTFIFIALFFPITALAASYCMQWYETPPTGCPENGEYENREQYVACGLKFEEENLDHWIEVGTQINELAKELPYCAMTFGDVPCLEVGSLPVKNL